jgi:hypothetical protein
LTQRLIREDPSCHGKAGLLERLPVSARYGNLLNGYISLQHLASCPEEDLTDFLHCTDRWIHHDSCGGILEMVKRNRKIQEGLKFRFDEVGVL